MQNNHATFDGCCSLFFRIDKSGNITGENNPAVVKYAYEHGITALALVHNFYAGGFGGESVHRVLTLPELRTKAVDGVYRIVSNGGYQGVNIDFENIKPEDQQLFNLFIQELAAKLKPEGYLVTISVPARTSDVQNAWSGAYDYAALGKVADQLMLMTYDEHWAGGSPGPVASLKWVNDVIKYAVSKLPAEKIVLGVAAYGYDWPLDGFSKASVFTTANAASLARKYGVSPKWDDFAQEPYFRYVKNGTTHEAWYENSYSLAPKLELVNQYNLAGIAIWRLGYEDVTMWKTIKEKFSSGK